MANTRGPRGIDPSAWGALEGITMSKDLRGLYEKPLVERVGSFEEITRAASDGNALDATFPVNTPFSELTFSD